MNNENVCVGKNYVSYAVGLKGKIIGEVIKNLDRSCVLYVKYHSKEDSISIIDKASKVVARYTDLICES